MKAYIITTGIVFALLAVSHVARVFVEGGYLVKEPVFVFTTIASVSIFVWAIILLKRMSRGGIEADF